MIAWRLFGLFAFLWAVITADRTLVVYDSDKIDLDHAPTPLKKFIDTLNGNGHHTVLRGYTDDDLKLVVGSDNLFHNIVLLPAASKKITNKDQLNKKNLLRFTDDGGNLIVVGDSKYNYPDEVREFLNEIGIFPSPKGYQLLDHFESDDKVKLTKKNIGSTRILSDIDTEYDGQTAIINNNEFLIPILTAPKTSFSSNDKINPAGDDNTWGIGQQSHVIVGLQALNNARVTWTGSFDFLTEELVTWGLKDRNLLKLRFVQHYKNDEPEKINHTLYRIKDQVIYTVGISEFIDNEWKPYVVQNEEDTIQLGFKMLDPYQRLNLEPLGEASSTEDGPLDTFVYYTNFTIPDQHGMFTFDLDYKRSGLSYIIDKSVVAVRHLANDEYKRSWDITNSWFYVGSAGFVIVAWLLFVVNFLYVSKVDSEKKNE